MNSTKLLEYQNRFACDDNLLFIFAAKELLRNDKFHSPVVTKVRMANRLDQAFTRIPHKLFLKKQAFITVFSKYLCYLSLVIFYVLLK